MYLYKKISKHKNVIYYVTQNTASSKNMAIICDFSKSPYTDKVDNTYEQVVAWINNKTLAIEWEEETEHMIDKDIIKHFAIIK